MPFFYSMISMLRVFRHSVAAMFVMTMTFSVAFAAPAPQPTTKVFVPPSRNEVLIRQYLYEAEDAFAHERLTSPKNDNAYAGYQRVLALDPRNEKARAGIKHISRRYLSMAKKAEQDSDLERALGYARQAQRMAPGYEGSAHMVKHLEQRRADYEKQQMQVVKAGGAAAPVTLKSKGNEYFLAAGDVTRRNLTAKAQLALLAEKAQSMDSRILIIAKNDGDGRWMYSQMRDSLTTDYRLRANIRVDSHIKIVLLDQPPEGATPVATTSAPAPQAAVAVHDGYVRAPVPGTNMTAAFMVISNDGDKPVQLVAVKSDVAAQLELHGNTNDNGTLRMRQLDKLDVPAKGEVKLAPGGLHLMLIDLRHPLVEKQQVGFTLVFGDGTEIKTELQVASVLNEAPAEHAHHH